MLARPVCLLLESRLLPYTDWVSKDTIPALQTMTMFCCLCILTQHNSSVSQIFQYAGAWTQLHWPSLDV